MGRIALGDRLSQAGREILYLRHSAWGVSGAITCTPCRPSASGMSSPPYRALRSLQKSAEFGPFRQSLPASCFWRKHFFARPAGKRRGAAQNEFCDLSQTPRGLATAASRTASSQPLRCAPCRGQINSSSISGRGLPILIVFPTIVPVPSLRSEC